MPDKPASERTEKPTPDRLRKAREEGQIPQSQEVPSALIITMTLIGLALFGRDLLDWFCSQAQQGFSMQMPGPSDADGFSHALTAKVGESIMASLPLMAVIGASSIFASMLVGGWCFAPKAIAFKPERLSPVKGLQNLFSLKSTVKLLVSLAKLTVILVIVYHYLQDKLADCMAIRWSSPLEIVTASASLVFGVSARIAAGLVVIAGVDLLYQKWNHIRQLRMTKQEIKQEHKEHEISPELRGRIKAVQMEMSRKRMLQEVPTADVVIANPTHVAVAIKYDSATMTSPKVVAKGPDLLCQKIKEIALEHNIPTIHRPELARSIYGSCEVGQSIPEALFVTVAEILAMIYKLRPSRS